MYYVYILSNKHFTIYIGVTNNLIRRVYEHKEKVVKGFTKEYSTDRLVYYEQYIDVKEAILREKRLKHWKREWKVDLIEKFNPQLKDLYYELIT